MREWTAHDLSVLGDPQEVAVETMREDGSLRRPVIVWIVRVGDDLYIRSVNGRDSSWFRGVQSRHQGRIRAGNAVEEVAFVEVDGPHDHIDAAYWDKYRRYPSIVPSIVKRAARAATIRVTPRETSRGHTNPEKNNA